MQYSDFVKHGKNLCGFLKLENLSKYCCYYYKHLCMPYFGLSCPDATLHYSVLPHRSKGSRFFLLLRPVFFFISLTDFTSLFMLTIKKYSGHVYLRLDKCRNNIADSFKIRYYLFLLIAARKYTLLSALLEIESSLRGNFSYLGNYYVKH